MKIYDICMLAKQSECAKEKIIINILMYCSISAVVTVYEDI